MQDFVINNATASIEKETNDAVGMILADPIYCARLSDKSSPDSDVN